MENDTSTVRVELLLMLDEVRVAMAPTRLAAAPVPMPWLQSLYTPRC